MSLILFLQTLQALLQTPQQLLVNRVVLQLRQTLFYAGGALQHVIQCEEEVIEYS